MEENQIYIPRYKINHSSFLTGVPKIFNLLSKQFMFRLNLTFLMKEYMEGLTFDKSLF